MYVYICVYICLYVFLLTRQVIHADRFRNPGTACGRLQFTDYFHKLQAWEHNATSMQLRAWEHNATSMQLRAWEHKASNLSGLCMAYANALPDWRLGGRLRLLRRDGSLQYEVKIIYNLTHLHIDCKNNGIIFAQCHMTPEKIIALNLLKS